MLVCCLQAAPIKVIHLLGRPLDPTAMARGLTVLHREVDKDHTDIRTNKVREGEFVQLIELKVICEKTAHS